MTKKKKENKIGVKEKYFRMEHRKELSVGLLNDYYGALLTDYQSELIRLYYDCDLSLQELADEYGISRQGVRDVLVRGEQKLKGYEQKLGLASKLNTVLTELNELLPMVDGTLKERLGKLIDEVKEI